MANPSELNGTDWLRVLVEQGHIWSVQWPVITRIPSRPPQQNRRAVCGGAADFLQHLHRQPAPSRKALRDPPPAPRKPDAFGGDEAGQSLLIRAARKEKSK